MSNFMNFSRQMELYNPEEHNHSINVIGLGATGSWVALLLSKLGVKRVCLCDMDTIELHNVPNQLYGIKDVGAFKTHISTKLCRTLGSSETDITTVTGEITEEDMRDLLSVNATFCLVDSMRAREELFEAAVRDATTDHLWIETRMGLTGYRIYVVNLVNKLEVDEYRKTLYNDDEAEVSACGASQSVVTTAVQCASHAVGLWLAHVNGAEYIPNELIYDVQSTMLLHKKFDKEVE